MILENREAESVLSLQSVRQGGLGATIASWNSRSQSENSGRKNSGIVFELLISVNCCTGAVAILQGAVLIRQSIVGVQKSSVSYFDGSEWRKVAMLIVGDSRNGRDSPRYLTIVPPACHPHFTTVASIFLPLFQFFYITKQEYLFHFALNLE